METCGRGHRVLEVEKNERTLVIGEGIEIRKGREAGEDVLIVREGVKAGDVDSVARLVRRWGDGGFGEAWVFDLSVLYFLGEDWLEELEKKEGRISKEEGVYCYCTHDSSGKREEGPSTLKSVVAVIGVTDERMKEEPEETLNQLRSIHARKHPCCPGHITFAWGPLVENKPYWKGRFDFPPVQTRAN